MTSFRRENLKGALPTAEQERMQYTYKERKFVFVDQLQQTLEELICPVCFDIVSNSQQTTCGHLFCEKCFREPPNQTQRDVKRVCPVCMQICTTHSDNFTDRRVRNLRVMCTNQEQGCVWVGSLGEAADHLNQENGCEFEQVYCINGCGERSQRRTMSVHISDKCPNRTHTCPYCDEVDTYNNIVTSHYEVCKNYPLPCPNNCGVRDIGRQLIQDHCDNSCPKESTDCSYKALGCHMQIERESLDRHLEESKDRHLNLAMGKVMDLTSRMEQLERTLVEVQSTKIEPMEREIQGLNKTVIDLQDRVEQQESCSTMAQVPPMSLQLISHDPTSSRSNPPLVLSPQIQSSRPPPIPPRSSHPPPTSPQSNRPPTVSLPSRRPPPRSPQLQPNNQRRVVSRSVVRTRNARITKFG